MNLMKVVLLLAVLILIPNVSASIHNVSGYVYEDAVGLAGVTVTDNESIDSTTTNATGYYFLEGYTNQTSYILTASKTGYTDSSIDIDFLDAVLTSKDITIVKTTLTGFLSDITIIVTSLTTMFTSIMSIFMEPPLILFMGVLLLVFLVTIVSTYLMTSKY